MVNLLQDKPQSQPVTKPVILAQNNLGSGRSFDTLDVHGNTSFMLFKDSKDRNIMEWWVHAQTSVYSHYPPWLGGSNKSQ